MYILVIASHFKICCHLAVPELPVLVKKLWKSLNLDLLEISKHHSPCCWPIDIIQEEYSVRVTLCFPCIVHIFFPSWHLSFAHCFKSTHIDSLFWLTSQSVGIDRMWTHTNKVYFAISFNRLSCQFAEKWATQIWAFFPFLRNIKFFSNKSLEYESVCLINWFNMIWWQK